MTLFGKVALVTGGSRGIGRAIVLTLAKAGADVAINYAGNTAAAEETAEAVKAMGRKAIVLKGDVADTAVCEDMIKQAVAELGRLDILVNNAGITRDGLLMRMKEEDWDAVIATNLKSMYNCSKAVMRTMMKQKAGRIINMASVVGETGNAGQANHAAAKAGVIGFTKALAKEVSSRHYSKRHCTGLYCYGHDESPRRVRSGGNAQDHSSGTPWGSARCCQCSLILRQRRSCLYNRPSFKCGRWHGNVV